MLLLKMPAEAPKFGRFREPAVRNRFRSLVEELANEKTFLGVAATP